MLNPIISNVNKYKQFYLHLESKKNNTELTKVSRVSEIPRDKSESRNTARIVVNYKSKDKKIEITEEEVNLIDIKI